LGAFYGFLYDSLPPQKISNLDMESKFGRELNLEVEGDENAPIFAIA
jgi:hypothetical protein